MNISSHNSYLQDCNPSRPCNLILSHYLPLSTSLWTQRFYPSPHISRVILFSPEIQFLSLLFHRLLPLTLKGEKSHIQRRTIAAEYTYHRTWLLESAMKGEGYTAEDDDYPSPVHQLIKESQVHISLCQSRLLVLALHTQQNVKLNRRKVVVCV